jgi:hypothetical protein
LAGGFVVALVESVGFFVLLGRWVSVVFVAWAFEALFLV